MSQFDITHRGDDRKKKDGVIAVRKMYVVVFATTVQTANARERADGRTFGVGNVARRIVRITSIDGTFVDIS